MVDFSKGINDEGSIYLLKRMWVTRLGHKSPRYLCIEPSGRYVWVDDYCRASEFTFKEVEALLLQFEKAHVSNYVYYKVFYY